MLMVASRPGHGAETAPPTIRRIRPDLDAVTNEQLVERFQQVEFSYFRQISAVLATITLFFALLLITVLLTVSVNQRLGEIAALRALGFSRRRMVADVSGGRRCSSASAALLALPLGLALSRLARSDPQDACPAFPPTLHFFVFEPRALALHAALLGVTAVVAALYPMRIVARLPIAATLRNEVVG